MNISFMREALTQAEIARELDEVPVGAVIVRDNVIIAKAHNTKEQKGCAVFHAEINAIIEAAKVKNNWYLDDCDLYVTLEPCPACAGAIINSRLNAVYFGAFDKKAGAFGSVYNLSEGKLNWQPKEICGGIMNEECASILSDYFKTKRKQK